MFLGGRQPSTVHLLSIDPAVAAPLDDVRVRRGRLPVPERDDEIILNEPFAEATRLQVGDSLSAVLNGRLRSLRVVGVRGTKLLRSRGDFVIRCCVTSLALAFAAASSARAEEARELRIVKQPGLAYLPLIVMRERRLIEQRAPGVRVEWRQLTSGPVIRDAMIVGRIDIGSGGFPPLALAIDKGLHWKAVGALNEMPLFLNCGKASIHSLKDLGPNDRIALPAIGSVQHIILQMQAERELGDPRKLDRQVVAMAHEDATAALLSHREITCHLSEPPYQYEQLRRRGIKKVFDSYQPMGGPHNFTLVWTSEEWAKANPKLLAAFVDAMREAMELIAREPSEVAGIYARSEKLSSSAEQIADIIRQPGIRYTMTPSGLSRFASFMAKTGAIKSARPSWRDYALPHLHELPGS